jgi:hypothetical protein
VTTLLDICPTVPWWFNEEAYLFAPFAKCKQCDQIFRKPNQHSVEKEFARSDLRQEFQRIIRGRTNNGPTIARVKAIKLYGPRSIID